MTRDLNERKKALQAKLAQLLDHRRRFKANLAAVRAEHALLEKEVAQLRAECQQIRDSVPALKRKISELQQDLPRLAQLKDELTNRRKQAYSELLNDTQEDITNLFHQLYYEATFVGQTWSNTSWLGVQVKKCPFDLWVYQEMISELKPDLIIETGTAYGGSALFFASICDMLDKGQVVTIDIESYPERPNHNRIHYLTGSSIDQGIIEIISEKSRASQTTMVFLDSDHSCNHVLTELKIYSKFVTKGSYIVVEDTNINGHPVAHDFGPGPMEAIELFLRDNKEFVVDRSKEKHFLTFNPRGFLLRKSDPNSRSYSDCSVMESVNK